MANITEILGTDSVSSSRPVINSNFELLNDELASVTALLNPTTAVLSGLTSATAEQIQVVDGTTLLVVNTSGMQVGTAASFTGSVALGGSIVKSGVAGSPAQATTNLAPSTLDKGTYFIDGTFSIPVGVDGQEVTLINMSVNAAAVNSGAGAPNLGWTSLELSGLNSTVTLRCFGSKWFVISSAGAAITLS
jgi:hypothetical protein